MSEGHGSEDWREVPLILLSGMGADERVFLPQLANLPNVIVPKWIEPKANETMAEYAFGMAAHVNPHRPCFIGGASFGGMLAVEMARHLDARCCFLIGSVGSPQDFPRWIRVFRKIPGCACAIPFKTLSKIATTFLASHNTALSSATRGFLQQFADADPQFLRWATSALLRWETPEPLKIPIYHIHGAKDRILSARNLRPDELLANGGHVISLSHGPAVDRFLREKMQHHCG